MNPITVNLLGCRSVIAGTPPKSSGRTPIG